jgi:hypothetical protein
LARDRAEREAELAERGAALEAAALRCETARREFEIERETRQSELNQRAAELEDLARDLAQRQAQHSQRSQDVEQIEHRFQSIEEKISELDAARRQLHEEQEAFEAQRLQTVDRLGREAQQLKAERRQLEADRDSLRADEPGSGRRDEAIESKPEEAHPPFDAEPSSVPGESPADTRDQRPGETVGSEDEETRRQPAPAAGDEEQSVEEYMVALLSRMRGDSLQPVSVKPDERRRNKRKSDAPQEPRTQSVPAEQHPVAVVDVMTPTGDLLRRPQPAMSTDLSAMRELANIQARQAIDTHGQKRSLHRAYGTLGTSIACLVAGFYVLYGAESFAMRGAGMVFLVVGVFWMATGLMAAKNVLDTMRRKNRSGLRAMLDEVDAEIAAAQNEVAEAAPEPGE